MKSLFLIIFAFFCIQAHAYTPHEGNVTASVGPYVYKTNFSGSASGAQSAWLSGLGLIVQGDSSDHGALEIAMFYMHKSYFRQENSLYVGENTEVIHMTMGYRYWFNQSFSASLAFFSAYSMGEPKLIHSDFAAGSQIDTSARDTTEYGADFSIQSELWVNERNAWILDTRYSKSVTSKMNENSDHYGFLITYKYLLQEKFPAKAKP